MLYLLEGGGKAPLQICLMRFLSGDGTQVRKVPLNSLNSLDGSIIPALWRLQLSLAVLMLTLALPPVVRLCFFLFFPGFCALFHLQQMLALHVCKYHSQYFCTLKHVPARIQTHIYTDGQSNHSTPCCTCTLTG